MTVAASDRSIWSDRKLTLDRLGIGIPACVDHITACGDRGVHLMEMGLTPGASVTVTRVALFGDPIEVVVRGYRLSLRRAEARLVALRSCGEGV